MRKTICVLIVDDARFMREVIRDTIVTLADSIVEASTLEEAETAAAVHQPNLVTLDLTLDANEAVQGVEALRRIRRAAPNARIAIVSALDQEWLRDLTAAHGAAAYIKKPFDKTELRTTLLDLLEETT